MKLRNLFLGLSMSLAALAACDQMQDPMELPAAIEANVTELVFENTTIDSKEFKLTSTRGWRVENNASWIAVSPEKGEASAEPQTIRVTVSDNPGGNRTANLTFDNGFDFVTVKVSQPGPEGETDGTITVQEFIDKADTQNYYKLKGTVSRFNAQFCSFDLTDATGTIYVYSVTAESKTEWSGKIKNGGTVVLQGKYEFYEAKSQHEVVDAVIESFEEGAPVEATDVTVAEFNAAPVDANKYYRLRGKVGGPIKADYGNFDIIDDTGKVYVYGISNWSEWKDKVAEGGSVVVVGTRGDYNGKIEVLNGYIESYGDEGGGEVTPPAEKPETWTKTTVKDFLAAAEDDTWYELTGQILNVGSEEYGNITIEDATGELYVYGLTKDFAASNDKSYSSIGLSLGDYVTFVAQRGSYQGSPQAINGFYLSHEEGELDLGDKYDFTKVTVAPSDWTGEYLIMMYDGKAHAAVSGKDFAAVSDVLTDNGGVISAPMPYAVTVEKSGSNYAIKLPDGKYLAASASANQAVSSATPVELTFEYTDAGVKITDVAANKLLYSNYSNPTNGTYYRFYVAKNQNGYDLPTLYKK